MTSPSTINALPLTDQEKHQTQEKNLAVEIGITLFLIGTIFLAGIAYGVSLETSAIFLSIPLGLYMVKWDMDIRYLSITAEENKDVWAAERALIRERISPGTPAMTNEHIVASAKN